MEKHENRQYVRKNKRGRIAKCIAVLLFAAVLTGIAAFGADSALGAGGSSNTGKDRKIPITYTIPSNAPGGGNFNSDCQGFYFYVTPVDAQQEKLGYFADSPAKILQGSLAYTGVTYIGEDNKTYQYTYRHFFETDDENSIRYRWVNEYNIARFQGYTSVIPQTEESLLFIPYATWTGKWFGKASNLKSGWKNNIAKICYYDATASTRLGRYNVFDGDYLNNRVFMDEAVYNNVQKGSMSEFDGLCTNGVFYADIAKLLVNDKGLKVDTNAADLIQIDALKKQLGTAAGVKTL